MRTASRPAPRLSRSNRVMILCAMLGLGWNASAQAQKTSESKQSAGVRQASHHGGHGAAAAAAQPPDLQSLIRSGWVQIVRFESPIGATVEVASSSGVVTLEVPSQVGLALHQTYRLRISNIPDRQDVTLYPSIRLIGYINPPPQVDPAEYPIPIHFLDRDVADVGTGRMLTNVVFLEDPLTALPVAFPPGEVPVVDIRPGDDPLQRASDLGRPIVVIQLGNRAPLDDQLLSSP